MKSLAKIVAFLFVIVALCLISLKVMTARLQDHRIVIAKWISTQLHRRVEIGDIRVSWVDYSPGVSLRDLTIFNQVDGKPFLRIHTLGIRPAILKSLSEWRLAFNHLVVKGVKINFPGAATQNQHLQSTSFTFNDFVGNINVGQHLSNLSLHSNGATLALPIFRAPLHFNQLDFSLSVSKLENAWAVDVNDLQLKNQTSRLSSTARVILPNKGEPRVTLSGAVWLKNVKTLIDYYPAPILPKGLSHWLAGAIGHSQSIYTVFHFQGPLSKFPFDHGEGQSLVLTKVHDLQLKYGQDWPQIQHLDASLRFDRRKLTIKSQRGELSGMPLEDVVVTLDHIGEAAPLQLGVTGGLEGDLQKAWSFVLKSPLQKTFGGRKSLHLFQPSGPFALHLNLNLPLEDERAKPHFSAELALLKSNLAIPTWRLAFDHLVGQVKVSEHGVQAPHIQGESFGKPVLFNIDTIEQADKSHTLNMILRGIIRVKPFSRRYHVALHDFVTGQADYKLQCQLQDSPKRLNSIILTSSLKGIGLHFPAPLNKPASMSRFLMAKATFAEHAPLDVSWDYAHFIKGLLQFHHTVKHLFFDQGTVVVGPGKAVLDGQQGLKLDLVTQDFGLKGHVFLPEKKPLQVQLSELKLTPLPETKSQIHFEKPPKMPAFDLDIKNLHYQHHRIGHFNLAIRPVRHGLNIQSLMIKTPLFDTHLEGQWRTDPHETQFHGVLKTSDLGGLLKAYDIYDGLQGSAGKFNYRFNWPGDPFSPTLAKVDGDVSLDFGEGHVVGLSKETNAKLGLGKILNLLSLQSIPKRLGLNFSDLTDKGYGFDELKGKFVFNQGVLSTKDAFVDGPVAFVGLFGQVGLLAHSFNLVMKVIPYVTSSLPIVATLAGGPIAGVIAWAANKVFSHQIHDITAHVYTVKGPWDNPAFNKAHLSAFKGQRPPHRKS